MYDFDGNKLVYHIDRLHEYLAAGDCFPLYVEVSPVGRCNHRCLFCAYDYLGYPDRQIGTARLSAALSEMAACGVRSVLFAGEGEPLLHPGIAEMVAAAKASGLDVGLFTNGHLLGARLAEAILPALTFLRVSFNGGTADVYSRVHGVAPGVFERVLENVRRAAAIKAAGRLAVDIGAQFVLLPENAVSLQAGARTLKDLGADYLAVKPFVLQNRSQAYRPDPSWDGVAALEAVLPWLTALSDERFQVIARLRAFRAYGVRRYAKCRGTAFISCVNSAGEVAACLPYWDRSEFVFGNLNEAPFREIWNGERRREVMRRIEAGSAGTCPPNCRPDSVNEFLEELAHPRMRHVNFV